MVVGTAEDHITSLQCVTTEGIVDPIPEGDDAGTETELSDLASDDLDLRAHRVTIRPARAMKAIQVRDVNDIVVEQRELTDPQPR